MFSFSFIIFFYYIQRFLLIIYALQQVEYSYPPLIPGAAYDSNECPPGWHYLPTLALPDGSHNYEDDTVYFHLPSLTNSHETIFGVSCFRQIPVEVNK